MLKRQRTLRQPVAFRGVGIHTGQACGVTLRPADSGFGRRFRLGDRWIDADVDAVVRCDRSTSLGVGDLQVGTVEHLLAAIYSAGISNVELEMDGTEIPIVDGSAATFARSIREAGSVEQNGEVEPYVLKRPIWVGNGACGVLAIPYHTSVYEYELDYPHPMLGHQHFEHRPDDGTFEESVARARTFALWEEVEPLLARGLAKGGDLQNALVVYQDRFSSELHYPNEPVRHKMLDLVGDLALFGRPIQARVTAVRAGHRWHVEMARMIRQEERST